MEDWDWNEFLEREGAKPMPDQLFDHVEGSQVNDIKPGMLLEVAHKSNPDVYWIAEITLVCGHVLFIKFILLQVERSLVNEIKLVMLLEVEGSLVNDIKPGMLLEVAHKSNPDVYWIAEITLVCGHVLFIKFIGADEGFWCDISTAKAHPLGWCGKVEEPVEPPDEINDKHGDSIIELMKSTLIDGISVSEEALNNKGLSPIDRIKAGMKVEVQNLLDPFRYWIATVEDNIGGRLLLKYDGSDDDLEKVWIFYGSSRLCGFGFVTSKGTPWQFKYPGKVNKFSCRSKLSAQLRLCAEESIKDPTPADLFEPKLKTEGHNFITGMKVEALDPRDMKTVRPATVVKVFNCYHFLVVLDDHLGDFEDTKMAWLCDLMHPYIFPVNWAVSNSMPFTVPNIWDTRNEFDWDEYLTQTSSVPAPEYCFGPKIPRNGVSFDMKLEAVNPTNPSEIHAASIVRIVENLIGLELLSTGEMIFYADNSDQIFPVGWCSTNAYRLHSPRVRTPTKEVKKERSPVKEEILEEERCQRIYFNYKCYAGPMISRNKLSQLPKHVGPGPLSLVVREVLNMMISASYKPAKMLKDWECEGPAEEGYRLETLKAKLKTSTHYAHVQVATSSHQVKEFCRDMCVKMQACPCLFGPAEYSHLCPETCQLVDKCRFQIGGDRRRGRGAGKRRKKGLHFMTIRAQERRAALEADRDKEGADSGNESENSLASTPRQSESGTRPNSPDSADYKKVNRKKREPRTDYPKLEMKTRGAKLPNFARQMKEGHWNKKDVETMYSKSCVLPKKRSPDTDSEHESSRSTNSKNNEISDVSDGEEPELKKLKFSSHDPEPSDNKLFERNVTAWSHLKLRLPENPLQWTVEDVHDYLSSTDDCKLMADKLREQEIDGPAFVMLNLPVIQEFLHVRTKYALMLCKHITTIKLHYIVNFQEHNADT